MKKLITTHVIVFLLLIQQAFAQFVLPHQPQRPPVNPGYPFTRSLFIDCSGDILQDISNGNAFGLKKDLNDYIRKNYIRYLILCGLEQANVFGNPVLEKALKKFMINTRKLFPGIRIGISGSEDGILQSTGYMPVQQFQGNACFPYEMLNNFNDFDDAVNNTGVFSNNFKRSELCKFFINAAGFGYDSSGANPNQKCKMAFDVLYLEYRYWNHNNSLTDMQNEFTNYKILLSVMQFLKCNNPCIRNIDAEFFPTEMYTLQAWTAIDQITEADPLIDRIMLPSFTNKSERVFDNICKMMHFLSDRFSKPHSRFFISLSAESPSFNYCNSVMTPQDYLGNYLNGTVQPSGNMYSVEISFLDKFNDPNYLCALCSCKPYKDNHYTSSNTDANELCGIMWGPYSMMRTNNLTRIYERKDNQTEKSKIEQLLILDINGKMLKKYKYEEEIKKDKVNGLYPQGLYLVVTHYENGEIETKKISIEAR